MANIAESGQRSSFSPFSATVAELKAFLAENDLPTTGRKQELQERAVNILETEDLLYAIEASAFVDLTIPSAPIFGDLPADGWTSEDLPAISEQLVKDYLRKMGGYTKNYRTGARLTRGGHVSHILRSESPPFTYLKARCKPTMRQNPPYYDNFLKLSRSVDDGTITIQGANCRCPAGETQSCVHIAGLLLTLAEVTQTACTSQVCLWSRPHGKSSKAQLSADLDFGLASSTGYQPYCGAVLDALALVQELQVSGLAVGFGDFITMEGDRQAVSNTTFMSSCDNALLVDPFEYLLTLDKDGWEVSDLVEALKVTPEEVMLVAEMTVGQRDNPLWMDARQWRITASNFGRIANRQTEDYPPSLLKLLLGDYGCPTSHAIRWGIEHENTAVKSFEAAKGLEVHPCGVYISHLYPFLAASPDGLIHFSDGSLGLIEVKCPFKHRASMISDACKDPQFCLQFDSSKGFVSLKRTHNYYYQVTGQLAITGACICYFVVWTCNDIFIEEIKLDADHWTCMQHKLTKFYFEHFGKRILEKLMSE